MSFMAVLTAAAPILIPAAIGAAGGAGIGALTSEDGFSDDGWWKGMLAGGLTGGIGGGMGMFSPAGGGLMGGSAIPSSATTGLSNVSLANAPAAGGLDAFMASIPTHGLSSPITATQGGTLGNFLGSTSGHGINFLGAPTDSLFGGLSGLARGDVGSMMPSNDTMMKGLLGSQIFKGMTKQDPKKEWTPQQARISPIGKMGAPMQLSRRSGQPGGAFMGGGQRGSLGSKRYS